MRLLRTNKYKNDYHSRTVNPWGLRLRLQSSQEALVLSLTSQRDCSLPTITTPSQWHQGDIPQPQKPQRPRSVVAIADGADKIETVDSCTAWNG